MDVFCTVALFCGIILKYDKISVKKKRIGSYEEDGHQVLPPKSFKGKLCKDQIVKFMFKNS